MQRDHRFVSIPTPYLVMLTLCALQGLSAEAATVKDIRSKMGSRFEITVVASDDATAGRAIARAYDEIDRIESMISSWRADSQTSEINRQAGLHPVIVSEELFNLVRRSLKLSYLTDGAFDITFAGAGRLWDFKAMSPQIPSSDTIRQSLEAVGYPKIHLDAIERSVYLDDPQARIGFGAIGKGYAANRAVLVLQGLGITSGVVNAGGDLIAFGRQENGARWEIGIAHPRHPDRVLATLPLSEQAVVTSGDYESFFWIDGKRYAHILDPRTGYPVDHVQSVTVVCPDAELADGLATAVAVLGPTDGLHLVEQLKGIEALLVDMEGHVHVSSGLQSDIPIPRDLQPHGAP